MPRPPRLFVPGGFYHVTLRGNHKEALFATPSDRRILNDIVAEALARYSARLHAFCWMTNHIHALIQVADDPLGRVVQSIAARYSRHRHRVMDTRGHLFERRHHARLVDVDNYFLTLLRYIHLNPVKAGMIADPAKYPWSSHRAYLGVEVIDWLTTGLGLSMFSPNLRSARAAYRAFFRQVLPGDEDLEDFSHPNDPRILGDDRFIDSLPVPSPCPRNSLTIDELAAQVCKSYGVDLDLVRSASSMRRLTPIRLAITQIAIGQRIATLTEVARFLGRDPSTISRLIDRYPTKSQ